MLEMQGIDGTNQLSPLAVLTAGGLAGVFAWPVIIPLDVLKSRFQSNDSYQNMRDVYQKVIAEGGAGALYAGLRPAMIRAFPANAACFFGMEVARKMLSFMD